VKDFGLNVTLITISVMKGLQHDRTLVQRMLHGEEVAFEEFFDFYFSALYRFVLIRLNKDVDASEEVVQRALCKAISKLSTYRGEAALFTWLCTFCRHEISSYLKSQKRFVYQPEFIYDNPEVIAALESLLMATNDHPDVSLLRKELAQLVHVALDALPRRYSDALEWKYIDGLSVKEIAERLDLGLKAAESLLTRARNAFRDAFESLSSGALPRPLLESGGTEG
jgi:RNA polymerase sigma-70 factor, ECF subfamily